MTGESARVTMLWPEELKEAVREKVGSRGLTGFTLAAVRAKLGVHDEHREDSKQLNEVRLMAQLLADAIVRSWGVEDRYAVLQEIGLPDWIDTTGWPDDIAALVKPEDSTPEPVGPATHHPVDTTVEPVAIDFYTVDVDTEQPDSPLAARPALEPDENDLMARVQAKAAEKGVDLSGIGLKPASEIRADNDQPEPTPERVEQVAEQLKGTEHNVVVERVAKPIANPNVCQNCGSELVGGECWECM